MNVERLHRILIDLNKDLKKEKIRPDEINLYRSQSHIGNFIDCVISGPIPSPGIKVTVT